MSRTSRFEKLPRDLKLNRRLKSQRHLQSLAAGEYTAKMREVSCTFNLQIEGAAHFNPDCVSGRWYKVSRTSW